MIMGCFALIRFNFVKEQFGGTATNSKPRLPD